MSLVVIRQHNEIRYSERTDKRVIDWEIRFQARGIVRNLIRSSVMESGYYDLIITDAGDKQINHEIDIA